MTESRPVDLHLTKIRLPVTAIVSIAHRISGVLLFVSIAYFLYLLDRSLASAASFDAVQRLLQTPLHTIVIWITLAVLGFHLTAGIRHLLMDIHIGDSLAGGRRGAWAVFAFNVILIAGSGVWLWS